MIAETIEKDGYKANIHYDEDPSCADPRDMDNLGFFYAWHPDYQLGDDQFDRSEFESMGAVFKHLMAEGAAVIIPLYLYDHSGLTISGGTVWEKGNKKLGPEAYNAVDKMPFDSAGWDTTMIGFAAVMPEGIKMCGTSKEDFVRVLQSEIEEYDRYLRGEVYWIEVIDPNGEEQDCCHGFLGDEYAKEAAKEMLDTEIDYAKREATKVREWAERDVVTTV